jgi:hypothetical protein
LTTYKTKGRNGTDNHPDAAIAHEALAVQQNTPRLIKKLKRYGYMSAYYPDVLFMVC